MEEDERGRGDRVSWQRRGPSRGRVQQEVAGAHHAQGSKEVAQAQEEKVLSQGSRAQGQEVAQAIVELAQAQATVERLLL